MKPFRPGTILLSSHRCLGDPEEVDAPYTQKPRLMIVSIAPYVDDEKDLYQVTYLDFLFNEIHVQIWHESDFCNFLEDPEWEIVQMD